MNEEQFWRELQQILHDINNEPEINQAQWEQLVLAKSNPSLPTQLITKTVCEGAVYFSTQSPLNFPAILPTLPLSANQTISLEMALSNSVIALISGLPATGKSRIAFNLAEAAISHSKRILILTHFPSALTSFKTLSAYPFFLSKSQNYQDWIVKQLREKHLAQPQMDYLPLHLLPDIELAQLRTPAKLERWLPIISSHSPEELRQQLQSEFPHLSQARLTLLAYRLKKLEPLLQQQLRLSQIYNRLSDTGINSLAQKLSESPQIPIVGTVYQWMQAPYLWETQFDLVIVKEAEYLTWVELVLLANLGEKLVLLGDATIPASRKKIFTAYNCFNYLANHLSAAYRYQLKEQFRLHPEIASSIYRGISPDWIQTQKSRLSYTLPQLWHRLLWQDIPNHTEGERIIEFLATLNPEYAASIGIITFSETQTEWLLQRLPESFAHCTIGTVPEWAGLECAIALLCCAENPQTIPLDMAKIALTRGQDYCIAFGDYDLWQQKGSPLRNIAFSRERRVTF